METQITEISLTEKIRQELQKNHLADEKIAELKQKYADVKVIDFNDVVGIENARQAWKAFQQARIGVEKFCKQKREAAIAYQKASIAEEKRLVALIKPEEEKFAYLKDTAEREKERIRLEKIKAEEQRAQERIKTLAEFGFIFNGISFTRKETKIDAINLRTMNDNSFNELKEKITLEIAEERRIAAEARAAAKAERERIRLLQEAQEREAARIRAIAAELAKKETEIKEAMERIEAEKRAAAQRILEEENRKKREAEIEAAKKDAVARALKEAEEKAKAEAAAKLEAERIAKEKEEMRIARQPDKERIADYITSITEITPPQTKTENGAKVLTTIIRKLQEFIYFSKEEINKL